MTSYQWYMELSYICSSTNRGAQVGVTGEFPFAPGTSREQAQEMVKCMLADHLAGNSAQPLDRAYVPNVIAFTVTPDLP